MCEELKERNTKENINLNFNAQCKHLAKINKNLIINQSYVDLQLQAKCLTGHFLDDKNCMDIVTQLFETKKNMGQYDILNRSEEFFFS